MIQSPLLFLADNVLYLQGGVLQMIVHSKMACPVKQKNGTWKVVVKEFDEDIPELGRKHLICNSCKFDGYPECMTWCGVINPKNNQLKESE